VTALHLPGLATCKSSITLFEDLATLIISVWTIVPCLEVYRGPTTLLVPSLKKHIHSESRFTQQGNTVGFTIFLWGPIFNTAAFPPRRSGPSLNPQHSSRIVGFILLTKSRADVFAVTIPPYHRAKVLWEAKPKDVKRFAIQRVNERKDHSRYPLSFEINL